MGFAFRGKNSIEDFQIRVPLTLLRKWIPSSRHFSKWGFEKGCVKDGKSKSNRDLLKIICLIIQILSSYQIPYNLNTWQFHPVIQVEIFVLNLDWKLNIPWLLSVLNISILYGINKHYIIIICDIETPNNKAFSLKYLLG